MRYNRLWCLQFRLGICLSFLFSGLGSNTADAFAGHVRQNGYQQSGFVNLAGDINVNELAAIVRRSCPNMRRCTYDNCPCAFMLPPEIDSSLPHGLRKEGRVSPGNELVVDYIDIMKRVVIGWWFEQVGDLSRTGSLIYQDVDDNQLVYHQSGPNRECMTMVGYIRLNNLQRLLEDVVARGVPGAFIEAGVWKGGSSAIAIAVFKAYEQFPERDVFMADSFMGIPQLDLLELSERGRGEAEHTYDARAAEQWNSGPSENVKRQLERLRLMNANVHFIEGFFRPALYNAAAAGMFGKGFSVIRLDGDTYLSTIQSLEVLYPLLHPSGYIIIDDYTLRSLGCRTAVMEYRMQHNITAPIIPVSLSGFVRGPNSKPISEGVWWQKT